MCDFCEGCGWCIECFYIGVNWYEFKDDFFVRVFVGVWDCFDVEGWFISGEFFYVGDVGVLFGE